MINLLITKHTKPDYLVKRLSFYFDQIIDSLAAGNKYKADKACAKINGLSEIDFKQANFDESLVYVYRRSGLDGLPEKTYDYVINNLPIYYGTTSREPEKEESSNVLIKKMISDPLAHFGPGHADSSFNRRQFSILFKGLIDKKHYDAAFMAMDSIVEFTKEDHSAYKVSDLMGSSLIPLMEESEIAQYFISRDIVLGEIIEKVSLTNSSLAPCIGMEDALRLHHLGAKELSEAIFYRTKKYPKANDSIDILLRASQIFKKMPDHDSWTTSASSAFDREEFKPQAKPLMFYAYHFLNANCNTLPFIPKWSLPDLDMRLLTLSKPQFLSGLREAFDASPDRIERAHELVSSLEQLAVNDTVKIALAKEVPFEILKSHQSLKRLLVTSDLSL